MTDPEGDTLEATITCFYCGFDKPKSEFSDEHIWPDALGGDYLPRFWRTNDVCARCNSISGVFVDGAFIRSWAGARERGEDARIYLSPTEPHKVPLPLNYLGKVSDPAVPAGSIADWWAGPCGATIIHFRPQETSEQWKHYVGGDPRAKKAAAGRAYIALASGVEYWVIAALASFKKHFKRAKRYVVTPGLPPEWKAFEQVDRNDPDQKPEMILVDKILDRARAGKMSEARLEINFADSGQRWLCKLGLAVGCQLFGASFGTHADGNLLRRAFREADPAKRQQFKIRGSGYFSDTGDDKSLLTWPAGWVLMLQVINETLSFTVITPSGQTMGIAITDDPSLIGKVPRDIAAGQVWIVVPSAERAVGPITTPDYAAHITKSILHPDLSGLDVLRNDLSLLPKC